MLRIGARLRTFQASAMMDCSTTGMCQHSKTRATQSRQYHFLMNSISFNCPDGCGNGSQPIYISGHIRPLLKPPSPSSFLPIPIFPLFFFLSQLIYMVIRNTLIAFWVRYICQENIFLGYGFSPFGQTKEGQGCPNVETAYQCPVNEQNPIWSMNSSQ